MMASSPTPIRSTGKSIQLSRLGKVRACEMLLRMGPEILMCDPEFCYLSNTYQAVTLVFGTDVRTSHRPALFGPLRTCLPYPTPLPLHPCLRPCLWPCLRPRLRPCVRPCLRPSLRLRRGTLLPLLSLLLLHRTSHLGQLVDIAGVACGRIVFAAEEPGQNRQAATRLRLEPRRDLILPALRFPPLLRTRRRRLFRPRTAAASTAATSGSGGRFGRRRRYALLVIVERGCSRLRLAEVCGPIILLLLVVVVEARGTGFTLTLLGISLQVRLLGLARSARSARSARHYALVGHRLVLELGPPHERLGLLVALFVVEHAARPRALPIDDALLRLPSFGGERTARHGTVGAPSRADGGRRAPLALALPSGPRRGHRILARRAGRAGHFFVAPFALLAPVAAAELELDTDARRDWVRLALLKQCAVQPLGGRGGRRRRRLLARLARLAAADARVALEVGVVVRLALVQLGALLAVLERADVEDAAATELALVQFENGGLLRILVGEGDEAEALGLARVVAHHRGSQHEAELLAEKLQLVVVHRLREAGHDDLVRVLGGALGGLLLRLLILLVVDRPHVERAPLDRGLVHTLDGRRHALGVGERHEAVPARLARLNVVPHHVRAVDLAVRVAHGLEPLIVRARRKADHDDLVLVLLGLAHGSSACGSRRVEASGALRLRGYRRRRLFSGRREWRL
mmetsp:Transcript_86632/g.245137  ORF Transcript_86632/g.245137 Transcript_86632/m.245137 type:complete len:690 (+) Transcript_86632:1338-3407(+)